MLLLEFEETTSTLGIQEDPHQTYFQPDANWILKIFKISLHCPFLTCDEFLANRKASKIAFLASKTSSNPKTFSNIFVVTLKF